MPATPNNPTTATVVLPIVGGLPVLVDVLKTGWSRPDWRFIEVVSESEMGFHLEITWGGMARPALFTLSKAGIICIYARELRIQGRTTVFAGTDNRITLNVYPTFMVTENVYEIIGDANPVTFTVPPFARAVRIEVDDEAKVAAMVIQLKDNAGTVLSELTGAIQPGEGIPVGGITTVTVTLSGASRTRALFFLHL